MCDFNCKSIIVHNLDLKVTENALQGIFALISSVSSVKITNDDMNVKRSQQSMRISVDKIICNLITTYQNSNTNRGFVEFHEHQGAEQALHAMDGRIIYGKEIVINWNNTQAITEDSSVQVTVTGLDHNVDDEILADAFKSFHLSEARVVSKQGEGIVTFTNKLQAEEAINQMDGHLLLSSNIHCHWPVDHDDDAKSVSTTNSRRSSTDSDNVILSNMSYEEIFAQTPLFNTSVCIKHLPKQAIKQDIAAHLQQYGVVSDIHMSGNKAIVKLDTHANAATAIFALQGINIGGKNVCLTWAEDRTPQRTDSQDNLHRSFNVFQSGYIPPSKLVNQIITTYDNHTTMRPPAPTTDPVGGGPGGGLHGWNQYYQEYYSAGHLTI